MMDAERSYQVSRPTLSFHSTDSTHPISDENHVKTNMSNAAAAEWQTQFCFYAHNALFLYECIGLEKVLLCVSTRLRQDPEDPFSSDAQLRFLILLSTS